jgi:DNA-binding XRE family transcriptional regulator
MRLYDPTSSGPQRTLHRAAAIANLDGKTMGVLENGKLNAVEILRELAALFEAHHSCTLRAVYSKSNPSAPAPPGVLVQAAAEVDFLITGLGD